MEQNQEPGFGDSEEKEGGMLGGCVRGREGEGENLLKLLSSH